MIEDLGTYRAVGTDHINFVPLESSNNVEFYYEGIKKLETMRDGYTLYGDNWKDKFYEILDNYEEIKNTPDDWEIIRNGLLKEMENRWDEKEEFITDEEIFV